MESLEIFGPFELVSSFGYSSNGHARYVIGYTGNGFCGEILECVSDYPRTQDPNHLMVQSLLLSLNTGVRRLGGLNDGDNFSQLIYLAQAAFILGSEDFNSISA